MTTNDLALIALLTFLFKYIIDWVFAPRPERQPVIVVLLFVVFLLWVVGLPIVITRQGG